ncbi:phosphatidylcholine:ceramide cholinephosphotransferase 2 [Protopterus annectens]|uniref:phosphatidylcholine:ceramide cholinephosphotransferase 2 n=1 Tax=Protopterus annectens TaxID=7888 RepID=UPI001CFBD944|nr:phosphatidylcholine:ceramide cholinephosphotransferase 2 [Protopterus annectens]XP_043917249.1 phosphatidylcholine:ceramide cholinephosphotransferase 2 [Protopterus annectens]
MKQKKNYNTFVSYQDNKSMETIQAVKLEQPMETQYGSSAASSYHRGSLSSSSDDGSSIYSKSNSMPDGIRKGSRKHQDYLQISVLDSKVKYPLEWWKTGIAFLYAFFNLMLTSVMIIVVHERVPPKEASPPLPDKFFDYIDRVAWAFSVTEICGMILTGLWLIQWLALRYKAIIGRRFFFIMGTLYLYRCITMYVTTLPVPGMHFKCAPKLHGDSEAKIQRVIKLVSGGGLSITGSHIMCGDFLFSGHTVILTITYLFIKEYSPRRFWWYHMFCWLISFIGVVCILLAHEHYTVDVVVAYFITSRLFWWYHSMANIKNLKCTSPTNCLSRAWWFPVFNFFEKNVPAAVPCYFAWPISCPPSCCRKSSSSTSNNSSSTSSPKTYSKVQKV